MRVIRLGSLLAGAALVLASCGPAAPSKGTGEVNVYNWTSYIPDDVKADFTKETGIKLNYEEYDSNETMLAKVTAGGNYDVVFPSQDFVPTMIQKGLLAELDKTKIPNLSAVDQNIIDFTQSFDPGNKYSVPYNIGATAIVYWKDKIQNPDETFGLFGDKKYKGKIVLMNDTREIFGAALHNLGFSGNTTDEGQIAKATDLILKWKANILKFDTDQAPTLFTKKEVWAAFVYPENILTQLDDAQKPNVAFFFPKEAGMKYQDNMVILKSNKNLENAYIFINYILRPDILARIDDAYGYPGISAKANALRKVAPFYSTASLDKHEFRLPLGDKADLYNKPWEEKILIGQ